MVAILAQQPATPFGHRRHAVGGGVEVCGQADFGVYLGLGPFEAVAVVADFGDAPALGRLDEVVKIVHLLVASDALTVACGAVDRRAFAGPLAAPDDALDRPNNNTFATD